MTNLISPAADFKALTQAGEFSNYSEGYRNAGISTGNTMYVEVTPGSIEIGAKVIEFLPRKERASRRAPATIIGYERFERGTVTGFGKIFTVDGEDRQRAYYE